MPSIYNRTTANDEVMFIINPNFLKKYDVALSFAEEDRAFVEEVLGLLKEKGIRVYYDDDQRVAAAGKDLGAYLDQVYRLQSKFCIAFISEHYEKKQWAMHELRIAQARSRFQKKAAYIIPYLLDDSSYADEFKGVVCFIYRKYNAQEFADAIEKMLEREPGRRLAAWLRKQLSSRPRVAVMALLLTGSTLFGLKHYLTPVAALARKLHEESRYMVHGSYCKDGTFSHTRGPGTCSGHQGVVDTVDTFLYRKTPEESRREAETISLIPAD